MLKQGTAKVSGAGAVYFEFDGAGLISLVSGGFGVVTGCGRL